MKAVLLMTVALAACSGDLTDPDAVAPVSAPSAAQYGLVVLSQTIDEPGVTVSGQLLDFAGVERHTALAALATPEDVWLTAPQPPPQRCRAVSLGLDTIGVDARVDVLDAGPLTVAAPDAEGVRIEPRDLPPIVATIGGVVYDAAHPDALPVRDGAYRIAAPGVETGAVSGRVRAPDPARLRGYEFDDDGLTVRSSGEGTLLLSRVRGAFTVGLLCTIDARPLRIDWVSLAHLGEGPADLALMSVQRAPLLIDGADAGDLLFVARDADELSIPREF